MSALISAGAASLALCSASSAVWNAFWAPSMSLELRLLKVESSCLSVLTLSHKAPTSPPDVLAVAAAAAVAPAVAEWLELGLAPPPPHAARASAHPTRPPPAIRLHVICPPA